MNAFTKNEAESTILSILEKWNLGHLKIEWMKDHKILGLACLKENKIIFSESCLRSLKVLVNTTKHEIAHFLQYQELGNTLTMRKGFPFSHCKVFKKYCRIVGVWPSRFIEM